MAATYNGSDKRLAYLFENGGGGGGGSANIWTGTMAEYIQQASQIADDTAVFITDDEIQSLIVSSYAVYSTDEKEVGVWTDGKPLYQKTIKTSLTVSSQSSATITQLTDIDHLMVTEGTFLEYGIIYTMNEMSNRISFNKSTGNLIFTSATGSSWNGEIQLTLQYTKASDVAGSGLFVPSGSAAVHYSTDEQVIGTWINGKPLYRKTITGLSIPMNADNWIYYEGISDVDNLVNLHAYFVGANGWLTCAISEYQRSTNHGVMMSGISSAFNRTINAITIEYTKTTD